MRIFIIILIISTQFSAFKLFSEGVVKVYDENDNLIKHYVDKKLSDGTVEKRYPASREVVTINTLKKLATYQRGDTTVEDCRISEDRKASCFVPKRDLYDRSLKLADKKLQDAIFEYFGIKS